MDISTEASRIRGAFLRVVRYPAVYVIKTGPETNPYDQFPIEAPLRTSSAKPTAYAINNTLPY
jgi:hypothetical protein